MDNMTTLKTETTDDGVLLVTIEGDLDSMGTRQIEETFNQILGQRNQRAVIDLAEVSFISSAGMAMLLVRGKLLRQEGGRLAIAAPNSRVMEVLSLAGFNEIFEVYDTIDEALEAISS